MPGVGKELNENMLKALGELVVNPPMLLVRSVDLNGSMGLPNKPLTVAGKSFGSNRFAVLFARDVTPKVADGALAPCATEVSGN